MIFQVAKGSATVTGTGRLRAGDLNHKRGRRLAMLKYYAVNSAPRSTETAKRRIVFFKGLRKRCAACATKSFKGVALVCEEGDRVHKNLEMFCNSHSPFDRFQLWVVSEEETQRDIKREHTKQG